MCMGNTLSTTRKSTGPPHETIRAKSFHKNKPVHASKRLIFFPGHILLGYVHYPMSHGSHVLHLLSL